MARAPRGLPVPLQGFAPVTQRATGLARGATSVLAAIAFDQPVAVVDGNIERVIARLFAIDTPLPAAKKAIATRQQAMTPEARAGDYAQAMMDLGAAICTPKTPACALCPLVEGCAAHASGEEDEGRIRGVGVSAGGCVRADKRRDPRDLHAAADEPPRCKRSFFWG